LVDQLVNSTEKRLARSLLLLARYGAEQAPNTLVPNINQTNLAKMLGVTRERVNFFMNKFRKMGFIEYNGELKIHSSLMDVVLRD
jgi:CRP/FNR family cyclic AMP-dependent transcriptional regulator